MRPDLSRMTSASIRSFLRRNPYRPYGRVSRDVEYLLLETATQVDVFYGLCDASSHPPTQEEFVKKYLDLCKDEISQKGFSPEEVSKRIARAWATYIGELDFYCQLRDSGEFDQVMRDTEFNAKKGYDVEVVYRGETYYLHLYYETPWAIKWLENKARRKAGIPKAVDFPLKEEDAELVGRIHLYTAKHVQRLRQVLDKLSEGVI